MILQYDSIILSYYVLLLEVNKLLRYDQVRLLLSESREFRIIMEDTTSPIQVERDYEIVLDKISKLSLKEDLPTDNPIVETITYYSLSSNKIGKKTREIVVS